MGDLDGTSKIHKELLTVIFHSSVFKALCLLIDDQGVLCEIEDRRLEPLPSAHYLNNGLKIWKAVVDFLCGQSTIHVWKGCIIDHIGNKKHFEINDW